MISNIKDTAADFHSQVSMGLAESEVKYDPRRTSMEEDVDELLHLRDTINFVEDALKQLKARDRVLKRAVCLKWVTKGTGDPIRGKLATGSPDVKTMYQLPKPGTPEDTALRTHFGVPDGAPFKVSFEMMQEYIAQCNAQGLPIPPGLPKATEFQLFDVRLKAK